MIAQGAASAGGGRPRAYLGWWRAAEPALLRHRTDLGHESMSAAVRPVHMNPHRCTKRFVQIVPMSS